MEEVPIRYRGRSYREGKKVTWRDGLKAIGTIVKYNLVQDRARWYVGGPEGLAEIIARRAAGTKNDGAFDQRPL